MKPLHERHGSKRKQDGSFDMSDPKLNAAITAEYMKKLASGDFKILSGNELALGDGVFVRTFVINEGTG